MPRDPGLGLGESDDDAVEAVDPEASAARRLEVVVDVAHPARGEGLRVEGVVHPVAPHPHAPPSLRPVDEDGEVLMRELAGDARVDDGALDVRAHRPELRDAVDRVGIVIERQSAIQRRLADQQHGAGVVVARREFAEPDQRVDVAGAGFVGRGGGGGEVGVEALRGERKSGVGNV